MHTRSKRCITLARPAFSLLAVRKSYSLLVRSRVRSRQSPIRSLAALRSLTNARSRSLMNSLPHPTLYHSRRTFSAPSSLLRSTLRLSSLRIKVLLHRDPCMFFGTGLSKSRCLRGRPRRLPSLNPCPLLKTLCLLNVEMRAVLRRWLWSLAMSLSQRRLRGLLLLVWCPPPGLGLTASLPKATLRLYLACSSRDKTT
jgi:hypothetical protein